MRSTIVFSVFAALIAGMMACQVAPAPSPDPEPVQHTLTVSSSEGGEVTTPGEGAFTYAAGVAVDLMAEADEGYEFFQWTGDVGSIEVASSAETTITMNGDWSVVACFEKVTIAYEPVDIDKTNAQRVYVHYMPWYETPDTSPDGRWGMHWTMNTQNPDIIDEEGRRQIASYFYPLIGPYASRDHDVIEYHLLLMKYAGVDGIMIDWYGVHDVFDYPQIRFNTQEIVRVLERTGLEFSIVYEDRTLPYVVAHGKASTAIEAAKADMEYLQASFFQKPCYTYVDDRPLLLVFGPITLKSESDWDDVFSGLNPRPCFLTLWYHSEAAGDTACGEYAWVYEDNSHLDDFYDSRAGELNMAMGSAYPGFVDFYEEGGWGDGIGFVIDHNDGQTLDETLQKAANSDLDMLQVVTWNDFGEGTMIEPTLEFGFSYLERVREYTGVSLDSCHFQEIHDFYLLRKEHESNRSVQRQLDQVFYLFVSMQTEEAIARLGEIREENQ